MSEPTWQHIDTAPKDRHILAADDEGRMAIVVWFHGEWCLTQSGAWSEDDSFEATRWAPGALPEAPPPQGTAIKKYWWDERTETPLPKNTIVGQTITVPLPQRYPLDTAEKADKLDTVYHARAAAGAVD